MSQAVTVYRWDDEGAPQAGECTYSELVNIIEKCLITGYGSKSPLGWVKELNEPLARSYKNLGSGHSVILSSTTGSDDDKGVRFQSARNVIDADNLENTGWKQAFKVFKGKNTSWVLVGTNKAFYCFFCYSGSYNLSGTEHQSGFFAGDLSNSVAGDTAKFIAVCSFIAEELSLENTTYANFWGSNIMFLNNAEQSEFKGVKIYDIDGSVEHSLYIPYELKFRNGKPTPSINSTPVNILEKVYLFQKDYSSAKDRDAKRIIESTTRPAVRGSFPGLCSTLVGHPENMTWPAMVSYGAEYLLLKPTNSTASRVILNTEVWDD